MTTRRVVIFGWAESIHTRRWLLGMRSRGFDVKLISLGGIPGGDPQITVFPRSGRFSYLKFSGAAAREANDFNPHLIHVHYASGFGLWGLRSKLAPTIVSVWGSEVLQLARKRWCRMLIKRVLKKATIITATSQYLSQATSALYPPVADKITVIPFGVDLPAEIPELPKDGPIRFCYLKAHRPVYGPDILLKALDIVRKNLPDVRLSLAGAGEMTGQLRRMVTDLQLQDYVEFPGMIEHDQIQSYIARYHFLVMPSRSESFGVTALEAAASGRAVIATRTGGIPEVVLPDKTGLLVPAGDVEALAEAILMLAGDREMCRHMGREGRAFVAENYRWQCSLDLMSSLYERLIEGRN